MQGEQEDEYQPIHTFTRTPCCTQILSYAVIIAQQVVFWAAIQPNYQDATTRIVMSIFMPATLLLLTVLCLIVSLTDPSDPLIAIYRSKQRQKVLRQLSKCLYCEHCRSYVYATSRHCKLCNRCIHHFDHHCIWINNCIGKQNYPVFIAMLATALAYMILFLVSVLLLWTEEEWKDYLPGMVTGWTLSAVVIVFMCLLTGLLILHCYLISNNLTTFNFIVSRRQAQQSRESRHEISENELAPQGGGSLSQEFKNSSLGQNQLKIGEEQHKVIKPTQEDIPSKTLIVAARPDDACSISLPSEQMLNNRSRNSVSRLGQDDEFRLMEFYKGNKSLKLLVGSQVLVRSQSARLNSLLPQLMERQSEAESKNSDMELGRMQAVETVVVKRKRKSKQSVK